MAFIITHPTDQHQAKYGYCSKCWSYNEVYRKDKNSICPQCNKKMIHISSWKISVSATICIIIFLYFYACN